MKISKNRFTLVLFSLVLILALIPVVALAGTNSSGGITLHFPDDMLACKPTFKISTSGVDPSWPVQWDLFESVDGSLVKIGSGSTSGNLDVSFTPAPLNSGESKTFAVFIAVSVPGQTTATKLSGQWDVKCEKETPPPPPGGEGCTPGFWKNHPGAWSIPTGTDFDATFGRDAFDPNISMLQAVDLRGGQLNALGRHAAAAYLNALSPVVSFDLSPAEVVAAFQAAFDSGNYESTKNMFEALNEQGCPY